MKDVYTQILDLSTISVIVCASVALIFMNFSKAEKTVNESRVWLKKIALTWAILNGIGFYYGLYYFILSRQTIYPKLY